jgi:uncharacterized membrane protein YeaQ/YmgE (transglycosylase-associated protein family)
MIEQAASIYRQARTPPFVAPGNRDNIPLWLTIVCGIVGVLIGYGWLGGTKGIDWLAFFVSIIFAAVLVMIAATVTGRSRKVGKA